MQQILVITIILALVSPHLEAKPKTVKFKNGDVYEGEWAKKAPNGIGIMTYSNGDVYSGAWVEGLRSGKGKMTYKTGEEYNGEWSSNHYGGAGTMVYANGDKFEGFWENGLKIGRGTMRYANGDVFLGVYQDDLMNGHGKMRFANGDIYDGNWVNGKQEGRGKFYDASLDRTFSAEWRDSHLSGSGYIEIVKNKFTLYGDWLDNGILFKTKYKINKKSFSGIVLPRTGDRIGGPYIKQGKVLFDNGIIAEGEWKDGVTLASCKISDMIKGGRVYVEMQSKHDSPTAISFNNKGFYTSISNAEVSYDRSVLAKDYWGMINFQDRLDFIVSDFRNEIDKYRLCYRFEKIKSIEMPDENGDIYTHDAAFRCDGKNKSVCFYSAQNSFSNLAMYTAVLHNMHVPYNHIAMDMVQIGKKKETIKHCFDYVDWSCAELFLPKQVCFYSNVTLVSQLSFFKDNVPQYVWDKIDKIQAIDPRFLGDDLLEYYNHHSMAYLALVDNGAMRTVSSVSLPGILYPLMALSTDAESLYYWNEGDDGEISINQSPLYCLSIQKAGQDYSIVVNWQYSPEKGEIIRDMVDLPSHNVLLLFGSSKSKGYVGYDNPMIVVIDKANGKAFRWYYNVPQKGSFGKVSLYSNSLAVVKKYGNLSEGFLENYELIHLNMFVDEMKKIMKE